MTNGTMTIICSHMNISYRPDGKYRCDNCGTVVTVVTSPLAIKTYHNVDMSGTTSTEGIKHE